MQLKKMNILSMLIITVLILITACGKSNNDSSPAPATTTITGSVFAAPVSGASVVVKNTGGTTVAGPVNTASDGTFSLNIPTSYLASDLRIESSAGSYKDEATDLTTTAKTLAAYVSGGTLTTGPVNLDPSTSIVCDLVTKHSKTFGEAQEIFRTVFGYAPDSSVASRNTPSTGASAAQRLAAFRAGAFSQLTKDLGLSPDKQFELMDAIADDLADGTLEGRDGESIVSIGTETTMPEDIGNRFECALSSFLTNTTCNLTGLTEAEIGSLPFSKVALTDTYRVQYIPGMMAAAQGKTTFQIKITRRDGAAIGPGIINSASLMPKMHMAGGMGHSTPVGSVVETGAGTGVYDCTVYYLMASGPGMGYWELKVTIGAEKATFYPAVSMAMDSDTIRATLYGQDDVMSSMSGTQYTKYYLFRDGAISASTPTFNLFISHGEIAMMMQNMNFVPASVGSVLNSPTGTVTSMTVQASTDSSFTSPVSAIDNGSGHWSVPGLTGLVSGQTNTIFVKMNVNAQEKTTNGNAASGTNAYATFLVTPGM